MSLTDLDKALKVVLGKEATSDQKNPSEEFGTETINTTLDEVWTTAVDPDPATAIAAGVVEVYSGLVLTEDVTVAGSETWSAIVSGVDLRDWIPKDKYGPNYAFRIFESGGSEIFLGDQIAKGIRWDDKTGILTIDDTSGLTPPYSLTHHRYIGAKGASGVNLNDLGDVVITTAQAGEVIKYDGNNWINDIDAGAASGIAGSGTVNEIAYFVGSSDVASFSGVTRTYNDGSSGWGLGESGGWGMEFESGARLIPFGNDGAGNEGTRVGLYAVCSGYGTVAVGVGARAKSGGATVVGAWAEDTATLADSYNVVLGYQARQYDVSGIDNIVIGDVAEIRSPTGTPLSASRRGVIVMGPNAWSQDANQSITLGEKATTVSGQWGVAIGFSARVSGSVDGIALGDTSFVDRSPSAIAIGESATVSSGTADGIAIGRNASANESGGDSGAISIGADEEVTGDSAVGIGPYGYAWGHESVSLGYGAYAAQQPNGSYAIAIGSNAYVDDTAVGGIAIGGGTPASQGAYSIGIGYGCWVGQVSRAIGLGYSGDIDNGSHGSIGIGDNFQIYNNTESGIAIGAQAQLGNSATGNADDSIAIGTQAIVMNSSTKTIAIGYRASGDGNNNVIIGPNAYVAGDGLDNVVLGDAANSNSFFGVVIGNEASVLEGLDGSENAVVIGYGANIAQGTFRSVAMGNNATVASGSQEAVAIGYNSWVGTNANGSVVVGEDAWVDNSAPNNVALGSTASVQNVNTTGAVAIGQGAQADATDNIAIGNSAYTVIAGSISIGRSALDLTSGSADTNNAQVNIGYQAQSFAFGTVTIGTDANIRSTGSSLAAASGIAIGKNARIFGTGQGAVVIGTDATNSGERNVVIGLGATASGVGLNDAVVIGKAAASQGNIEIDNAVAIGANIQVYKNNSNYDPQHARGAVIIGEGTYHDIPSGVSNTALKAVIIGAGAGTNIDGTNDMDGSVVVGGDSYTMGGREQIVIGYQAGVTNSEYPTNNSCIAIGGGAYAGNDDDIGIGRAAYSNGSIGGIYIGADAWIGTGAYNIGIGWGVDVDGGGDSQILIGKNASSDGTSTPSGILVGANTKLWQSNRAVIVGGGSSIGTSATGGSHDAIAIGAGLAIPNSSPGAIWIGGNPASTPTQSITDGVFIGNGIEMGLGGNNNIFIMSDWGGYSAAGDSGVRNVVIGYQSYIYSGCDDNVVIGNNSNVQTLSSDRNVTVGTDCQITGGTVGRNVAIGSTALIDGDDSVYIGGESQISGTGNVSIGLNSVVNASDYAIAIGENADVRNTSHGSIAIGHDTVLYNNTASGILIGASAQLGTSATGNTDFSIAIGAQALVQDSRQDSIAIGRSATISGGSRAIAIGLQTLASGVDTVAIGYQAKALAGSNIAIGDQAVAEDFSSIAIGGYVYDQLAGGRAISIGIASQVQGNRPGEGCIGIGDTQWIDGAGVVGIGNFLTVDVNESATVIGGSNGSGGEVYSDFTVAIGSDVEIGASSQRSTVIGGGKDTAGQDRAAKLKASSPGSIIIGNNSTIWNNTLSGVVIGNSSQLGSTSVGNADYSIVVGPESSVDDNSPRNIVIGYRSYVGSGHDNNIVIGWTAYVDSGANHDSNVVIGENAYSTDSTNVVIGPWSNVQNQGVTNVAIGEGAEIVGGADYSVNIGDYTTLRWSQSVVIGEAFTTQQDISASTSWACGVGGGGYFGSGINKGVIIGFNGRVGTESDFGTAVGASDAQIWDSSPYSVALGAYSKVATSATGNSPGGTSVGYNAVINNSTASGIALGANSNVTAEGGIAIGVNTLVDGSHPNSVAIGREAFTTASGQVIFGSTNYPLHLHLYEQAAPGTPLSGTGVIYPKTDGKLYYKNDAGTEFDLTISGGTGGAPEYSVPTTISGATTASFGTVSRVNATGGSFVLTLPTASGNAGKVVIVKNIGTTNTVTISGQSGENIDGSATVDTTTQYESIHLVAYGTDGWGIL